MTDADAEIEEEPLVLTDDELVSLAVGVGVAWPSSLPSLGDELEELDAPAWRGLRSLKVRQLAGPGRDGTVVSADLLALLEPAFSGGLKGVAAWVTKDGSVSLGFSVTWYEGPEYGLLECTTSEGIHGFSECDRGTWKQVATNLVALAHRGELHVAIGGQPATGGISVAVPSPAGEVRSLLVTIGSARMTGVVDGQLSLGPEGDLTRLLEAVLN
jgi:hypothetical protein